MKFERVMLAMIFGALIAAQFIWMPKAKADDQSFVAEAESAGFQLHDISGVIWRAKAGCENAINHHDTHAVAASLKLLISQLTEQDITDLAVISIRNFCPIVFSFTNTYV